MSKDMMPMPELPILVYLFDCENGKQVFLPVFDPELAEKSAKSTVIKCVAMSCNKSSLLYAAAYLEHYCNSFMDKLKEAMPSNDGAVSALSLLVYMTFKELIDELDVNKIVNEVNKKPIDADLH